MKKFLLSATFVLALCSALSAQKVQKPTLTPKPPTTAQENLIKQGIALHDAKKYDEAIALYQKVLDENPDCVFAIYEMALSYYNKKDFVKTVEVAMQGLKYDSDQLPLFYGMVANVWDDKGNPEKAIELYKDGIKILEKLENSDHHLSSMYYNLGVTYFRQKEGAKGKRIS